jgi:hypothetical protein
VLMPLDKMTDAAQWLATITPLRYAFHLTLRCGEQLAYLGYKTWDVRPVRGDLGMMGLRPSGAEAMGLEPTALVAMLVASTACFGLLAVLILRRRR